MYIIDIVKKSLIQPTCATLSKPIIFYQQIFILPFEYLFSIQYHNTLNHRGLDKNHTYLIVKENVDLLK